MNKSDEEYDNESQSSEKTELILSLNMNKGNSDSFNNEITKIRQRSSALLEQILTLSSAERKPKRKKNFRKEKSKEEISPINQSIIKDTSLEPKPPNRYEQRLQLLQAQLMRKKKTNTLLKAKIKNFQIKLQNLRLEEEKIRETIMQSQQERLRVRLDTGLETKSELMKSKKEENH